MALLRNKKCPHSHGGEQGRRCYLVASYSKVAGAGERVSGESGCGGVLTGSRRAKEGTRFQLFVMKILNDIYTSLN